jgi:hypothetical protein
MKYKVQFELYNKKMQTTIEANNPDQVKQAIFNKIKFYKIEPEQDAAVKNLMDILGMK